MATHVAARNRQLTSTSPVSQHDVISRNGGSTRHLALRNRSSVGGVVPVAAASRTPTAAGAHGAAAGLGSTVRVLHLAYKSLSNKLAYEWKNIYRALAKLCSVHEDGLHQVTVKEFDEACHRFGVSLHREDLRQIEKLFGTRVGNLIDFDRISKHLGMHRASYDHLT